MSPGLQPCLAKNQFPTFHDPLCHYLQIDMRFLEFVAEAFACPQHVVAANDRAAIACHGHREGTGVRRVRDDIIGW